MTALTLHPTRVARLRARFAPARRVIEAVTCCDVCDHLTRTWKATRLPVHHPAGVVELTLCPDCLAGADVVDVRAAVLRRL